MNSRVVSLAQKRAVTRTETFAEYIPLEDGGVAIIADLDGLEVVWELTQAQVELVIQALSVVLTARRPVKILQPLAS